MPLDKRWFSILNMSSAKPPPRDDRTAKSRIRDAAIQCFAKHGIADTTARRVAEAAEVSPGLIIHHFGSMEGLRLACDGFVASRIRELKEGAAAAGPNLDVLAAIRESDAGYLLGYLAAVLTEDSPAVARLVDDLVADAERYTEHFVEAGIMRPSENPRGRAALLVVWSLGALALHNHLERLLGVDLTDPEVTADPSFAAYALPVYEFFGGVLSGAFAEHAKSAFSAPPQGESK